MKWCGAILATVVAVGLIVAGCGSAVAPPGAIIKAARAPYIAVIGRNARALCAAFTPAAADHLARDVSRSDNCVKRVAEAFARAAPFEPRSRPIAPNALRVTGVIRQSNTTAAIRQGNTASAFLVYGAGGSGVRVTIEVERIGSAWRVASRPMLRLVSGCYTRWVLTESCSKNARVMVFSIGKPKPMKEQGAGISGQQLVPVPPAVEDAGGRELREVNVGMEVVAQSGCLGCHRIGERGNVSPGPNLTHIGSILSEREIKHAILDPSAPMPSFKNLPKEKLTAVGEFLSQLRTRKP
jgi:mono/diheme cytochrome c family protein